MSGAANKMLPIGSEKCQCGNPACRKFFTGDSAFQRHRITDINTGARRCLSTEEMYKIGMNRVQRKQGRYWEWGASLTQLGKEGTTIAEIVAPSERRTGVENGR